MKILEKTSATAAIIAALSTLACCVPLGFVGALGLAGVSVWAQRFRPWLMGAAIALLCVGFVQIYFKKSCTRRSPASLALFWTAAVIVVLTLLFPQFVATLIAG